MLPDSKRRIVLPSGKESVRAGIRPLGLIWRNQGSFWVSLVMSMAWVLYGKLCEILSQKLDLMAC